MRIATVVSTVGYHWEELFGAYDEFERAGAEIDVFTVDGSPPKPDPMSLRHTGPLTLIGLGVPSRIDPSTPRGRELLQALTARRAVEELNTELYDALYLPGGHGCLFDVNRNEVLHDKLIELYRGGKILSAVCHATSTFAFTRIAGRSIAAGKQLTGFPHAMDEFLIRAHAVDPSFLPLPFSNEHVLRQEGIDVPMLDPLRGSLNPRHMCVSLPFVTGVGPKSARPVAREVLSVLRARTATRFAA
jgi:putative intracellular protease/amidase